jgi:hypothetical protein
LFLVYGIPSHPAGAFLLLLQFLPRFQEALEEAVPPQAEFLLAEFQEVAPPLEAHLPEEFLRAVLLPRYRLVEVLEVDFLLAALQKAAALPEETLEEADFPQESLVLRHHHNL